MVQEQNAGVSRGLKEGKRCKKRGRVKNICWHGCLGDKAACLRGVDIAQGEGEPSMAESSHPRECRQRDPESTEWDLGEVAAWRDGEVTTCGSRNGREGTHIRGEKGFRRDFL